MDALSIWPGNDYVYFPNRRRSEEYRDRDYQRISVLRIEKRTLYGNSRESTYVICRFKNDDGTPKMERKYDYEKREYIEEQPIHEVRSRDVVSLWSHFADEMAHRNSKRDREEAERQARIDADNAKAIKFKEQVATLLGVPVTVISIRWNMIEIDRNIVERLIEERFPTEPEQVVVATNGDNDDDEDSDGDVAGSIEDEPDHSDYMRSILDGR